MPGRKKRVAEAVSEEHSEELSVKDNELGLKANPESEGAKAGKSKGKPKRAGKESAEMSRSPVRQQTVKSYAEDAGSDDEEELPEDESKPSKAEASKGKAKKAGKEPATKPTAMSRSPGRQLKATSYAEDAGSDKEEDEDESKPTKAEKSKGRAKKAGKEPATKPPAMSRSPGRQLKATSYVENADSDEEDEEADEDESKPGKAEKPKGRSKKAVKKPAAASRSPGRQQKVTSYTEDAGSDEEEEIPEDESKPTKAEKTKGRSKRPTENTIPKAAAMSRSPGRQQKVKSYAEDAVSEDEEEEVPEAESKPAKAETSKGRSKKPVKKLAATSKSPVRQQKVKSYAEDAGSEEEEVPEAESKPEKVETSKGRPKRAARTPVRKPAAMSRSPGRHQKFISYAEDASSEDEEEELPVTKKEITVKPGEKRGKKVVEEVEDQELEESQEVSKPKKGKQTISNKEELEDIEEEIPKGRGHSAKQATTKKENDEKEELQKGPGRAAKSKTAGKAKRGKSSNKDEEEMEVDNKKVNGNSGSTPEDELADVKESKKQGKKPAAKKTKAGDKEVNEKLNPLVVIGQCDS